MKVFKKIASLLATAYILLFFSEFFFLNEEPVFRLIKTLTSDIKSIVFMIEFILMYLFFSYVLLIVIQRYRVNNIWALVLAGSLFGWWTEGVVIPVIYEAIPITIFWPSIGWHVIVDVLIGWYLFRKILHLNIWYLTATLTLIMGAFWGIWATWFWIESTARIIPSHFTIFAFTTSAFLITAYLITDLYPTTKFYISKIESIIFISLSIIFLGLLSFSYGALPWIILGPLTALTIFALSKGNKVNREPQISFEGNTLWWQYLILFFIPVIASAVYSLAYSNNLISNIGEILPLLLMITGFIMYGYSLYYNMKKT